MDSVCEIKNENNKKFESVDKLGNLKSKFVLKIIFNSLRRKKLLEIIKYNKKTKNRLDIYINDYMKYSEMYSTIEIEAITIKNNYGTFININNECEKGYFHIYFNDNKEEIKRNHFKENEAVFKIKILIDHQVKSLNQLFKYCNCIESIYFKKCYRNINDMSYMFCGCTTLKEVNFSKFNTNKVTDMQSMFFRCSSLKELNLSDFNTRNVKNMSYMFSGCSSLKELYLSSFNTNNVIDMSFMFDGCSSLVNLNISSFNTDFVMYMNGMFHGCSSLKTLNLSNFNTNNVINISYIFDGCTSLVNLTASNFELTNCTDKKDMFRGCSCKFIY